MSPRKDRLERGIVVLFKQAYHEGHTEVAEHIETRANRGLSWSQRAGGRAVDEADD